MEEAPRGVRLPQDEPLFRQRINDLLIEPDRVSPVVEGYFRIPAVWIVEAPDPSMVKVLNPSVHHAIVVTKKLKCGIEVRVQRDGMFLFDFSTWPLAPTITIPGFRKPNLNGSYRRPVDTERAEGHAEAYAVLRAQVMNAHQACLTTSESVVRRRSAMTGFPITSWSTYKAIDFSIPPSYDDDIENLHALGHNVLNNKDMVVRKQVLSRRVLEQDVVEYSLDLLDTILINEDAGLIQLVETAYIASCRNREKRFGEALILAWGVCEQLISTAWNALLDDAGKNGVVNRMPKTRVEKLNGRDYSASVMVEMLEVAGRIDHEMHRRLEVARKARNKWAHEMRAPKESEVYICIQAIELLLGQLKGISLSLQSGGRGAVPQWPIWMLDQVRSQGGA